MSRASARPPSLPAVLAGKFRPVAQLGADAETVTFLAEHTGIKRQVELKVLGAGAPFPGPGGDRLLREARAIGAVSHPSLQGIVDSGLDNEGRPFVVYEALRGISLLDLLASMPLGLPAMRAARIALPVLEALAAMHRAGVVARGLGPQHVILLDDRDEDAVKVRAIESVSFLSEEPPEMISGSPWIAPEAAVTVDPRCDVYSGGAMLHHLLSGRPRPFPGAALPEVVRAAITRATQPHAEDRFPDLEPLTDAVMLLLPLPEPSREALPTPRDAGAVADLQYLALRRDARPRTGEHRATRARVKLMAVLLAIESIYRRLGEARWARLVGEVPGVDDLLPGSGKTDLHMATGVSADVFSRVLAAADAMAGRGDLSLVSEVGQDVAQRGLSRLWPAADRVRGPASVVDAFPYLWSSVSLEGTATQVERGANLARYEIRDQTEPSLEISAFVAGIVRTALRKVGGPQCDVTLIASCALGDAADVFRITW